MKRLGVIGGLLCFAVVAGACLLALTEAPRAAAQGGAPAGEGQIVIRRVITATGQPTTIEFDVTGLVLPRLKSQEVELRENGVQVPLNGMNSSSLEVVVIVDTGALDNPKGLVNSAIDALTKTLLVALDNNDRLGVVFLGQQSELTRVLSTPRDALVASSLLSTSVKIVNQTYQDQLAAAISESRRLLSHDSPTATPKVILVVSDNGGFAIRPRGAVVPITNNGATPIHAITYGSKVKDTLVPLVDSKEQFHAVNTTTLPIILSEIFGRSRNHRIAYTSKQQPGTSIELQLAIPKLAATSAPTNARVPCGPFDVQVQDAPIDGLLLHPRQVFIAPDTRCAIAEATLTAGTLDIPLNAARSALLDPSVLASNAPIVLTAIATDTEGFMGSTSIALTVPLAFQPELAADVTELREGESLAIRLSSPVPIAQGQILVNGRPVESITPNRRLDELTLTDALQPGMNMIGMSATDTHGRTFENKSLIAVEVVDLPEPRWPYAELLAALALLGLGSAIALAAVFIRKWDGNRRVCTLKICNTGNIAAAYKLSFTGHGNAFDLHWARNSGMTVVRRLPDLFECTSRTVTAGETLAVAIEIAPRLLNFQPNCKLTVDTAPVLDGVTQPYTTDVPPPVTKPIDMSNVAQRNKQTLRWAVASLALAILSSAGLIFALGQFTT